MPATRHFITQCLRLLQLVLTNLALLRPILGCSPAVVQVASADGSVFEQWLHNGMASDARRPAHLMQAYVRGDMPSKADILPREHQPEAYNIDVGSSIQPAEYHLGYAAERGDFPKESHVPFSATQRNASGRVRGEVRIAGDSLLTLTPMGPGGEVQKSCDFLVDTL